MKFQNPSMHGSKVTGDIKSMTDECNNERKHKPKAISPTNFFKVGGIKNIQKAENSV